MVKVNKLLKRISNGDHISPEQIIQYTSELKINLTTKLEVKEELRATWLVALEYLDGIQQRQTETATSGLDHDKIIVLKKEFKNIDLKTIDYFTKEQHINHTVNEEMWLGYENIPLIKHSMTGNVLRFNNKTYEFITTLPETHWFSEFKILSEEVRNKHYVVEPVVDTRRLSVLQSYFLQEYCLPENRDNLGWYSKYKQLEKNTRKEGHVMFFPKSDSKDLIVFLNGFVDKDTWDRSFKLKGIYPGKNGGEIGVARPTTYALRNAVLEYTASKEFLEKE